MTFALSAIIVAGCGDDATAAPRNCDPTIEEWCAENDRCDGFETRAQALAGLLSGDSSGARSCNEGNTLILGDGFVGRLYTYEPDGGALIGGGFYSDQDTPDDCAPARSAGEVRECEGARCTLREPALSASFNACTGEIAEPFIKSCLDDPPALIVGCEECACPVCYPPLRHCKDEERRDAGLFESCSYGSLLPCLETSCSQECADQIEAFRHR